jgi:hypothetical protein
MGGPAGEACRACGDAHPSPNWSDLGDAHRVLVTRRRVLEGAAPNWIPAQVPA